MAIVKASIQFGFQAGPNYKSWAIDRRRTVKQNVRTDLEAKTSLTQLESWANPGVDLTVDGYGSALETDVRALLNIQLAKTVSDTDFPVVIRLKGGTGATPESIIYVWRNGKRYCEHAYLLTTELKPIDVNPVKDWDVADEDEKPKMFARVSWPI